MASGRDDPPHAVVDDLDGDDGAQPSFGDALRRLRRHAGFSQTDLANRVHYSKTQISRVENGRLRPSIALAKACERELGAHGTLTSLIPPPPRRRSTWSASAAIDLPSCTALFFGRDQQLDQIQTHVKAATPRQRAAAGPFQRPARRVVVVWGLPGVGKTELVVQAAERLIDRYPDGCLYLDLRGATEPIDTFDAMGRLLRRLGISSEVIPTDQAERGALYRRVLRGRRVLLVLDNPQHAADIAALSAPGRESITLVASRRRLDALDEAITFTLNRSRSKTRADWSRRSPATNSVPPGPTSGTSSTPFWPPVGTCRWPCGSSPHGCERPLGKLWQTAPRTPTQLSS